MEHVSVQLNDLRLIATTSLRYAINRSTYITGATVDILKRLPVEVWDEKTLNCALTDLKMYIEEWDAGYKPNMDCDHDEFVELYKFLSRKK